MLRDSSLFRSEIWMFSLLPYPFILINPSNMFPVVAYLRLPLPH